MAKHTQIIHLIREKLRTQEYEFAIPHFFEEMANDGFEFADIEMAILNGSVNTIFTDDPRGNRYEIVGQVVDGRTLAVICKIKATGKLLLITTWEIHE
jgi:hypothetical protein